MNLKAAIFDMDGTLVDSLGIWNVLWEQIGRKYRNDPTFLPSKADDKAVRTMLLADAMELIHRNYGVGESGAALLQAANEMMEDFYAYQVELKPGVRKFLDTCLEKGVKMCIASATARNLVEIAMEHCDLKKYFLRLFSCGDIGKGKDQPDIFLVARDFLGESTEDTWLFEDSLVAIETATKIGMPTVAIYDQFNYGQDRMRRIATHYIAEGETLMKLFEQ